jgi:NAD(P)-dependent dehydrogenase (short-subunit alcohol dehydrogenase family)
VTGAAGGMGLAVAERFLAEGRVVVGVEPVMLSCTNRSSRLSRPCATSAADMQRHKLRVLLYDHSTAVFR